MWGAGFFYASLQRFLKNERFWQGSCYHYFSGGGCNPLSIVILFPSDPVASPRFRKQPRRFHFLGRLNLSLGSANHPRKFPWLWDLSQSFPSARLNQ